MTVPGQCFSIDGKKYIIGEPLSDAEGGQGKLYRLKGMETHVVKIFNEMFSKDPILSDKLDFLVNSRVNKDVFDSTAWPTEMFSIQVEGIKRLGMIMWNLGKYIPLSSMYKDPSFSTKNRVDVAISLCRTVEILHKNNIIIGDFNDNNIGVSDCNSVNLFDVDSMQMTNTKTGKFYKCPVGVKIFVPPEALEQLESSPSKSFIDVDFTKETDYFALGNHIFRLLTNNYDPFIGTDGSIDPEHVGDDDGIRENLYCFKSGLEPYLKNTPDCSLFSDTIQSMFEKTFIDGHTNPKARCKPDEWRRALEAYKSTLKQCCKDEMHWYPKNRSKCPFCDTAFYRKHSTAKKPRDHPKDSKPIAPSKKVVGLVSIDGMLKVRYADGSIGDP